MIFSSTANSTVRDFPFTCGMGVDQAAHGGMAQGIPAWERHLFQEMTTYWYCHITDMENRKLRFIDGVLW